MFTFILSMILFVPRTLYLASGTVLQYLSAHVVLPQPGKPTIINI